LCSFPESCLKFCTTCFWLLGTPCFEKCLTVPYLDTKQHLSTQQSGNRRFHSTETSLIETTDSIWNAIDGKELMAHCPARYE
jgi:hypothetical protein